MIWVPLDLASLTAPQAVGREHYATLRASELAPSPGRVPLDLAPARSPLHPLLITALPDLISDVNNPSPGT